MQNVVQIFKNPDFGDIRTVVIDDEPWFVGRDVASALGYAKPENAIPKWCDSEDTLKWGILSNGGKQQTLVINESGLYSLIFGSKLESAKKFKKWVTSEVLPSIRNTGGYQIPHTTDGKIALLAQGHIELKAEVDEIKADIESLKMDLPLLPVEADEVNSKLKQKGTDILGGKQSNAYNDRSLRQKLYINIHSNLRYNFGVNTYKAIKRSQLKQALEVVSKYEPPVFLQEQIDGMNAQQRFQF